MVWFFPKNVVRSQFSSGVNLHKALEENQFSSTAALDKRAVETTGQVQRFSCTSPLGVISFYVHFPRAVGLPSQACSGDGRPAAA